MVKILPLYKNKGEKTEVENFGPLALLSPISKLVEKEIQYQILKKAKEFKSQEMNNVCEVEQVK